MVTLLLAVALAAPVEGRIRQKGDAAPVPDVVLTWGDVVIPVSPEGDFTVDLPDGVEHVLVVASDTHVGQDVRVVPPLDGPLRVWLKPQPAGAEIVVEAFRPTSDMTRHGVDAEQAYETPGTFDDPVRLVQALPAVVVQREYAPSSGEVNVRGSLPGDNRFYVDGIEVPYLYHFNQYASVLPASQLSRLDLYPSSFGAKYGDATGAIIEARSDDEAPTDLTGHATISTVTVGLDAKGPLGKGWWMGGSVRRSFHDVAGASSTQFPRWPVFYDFSARATKDTGSRRFTVYAFGAGDGYTRAVGELDILDPVEQDLAPQLDFDRHFQIVGFRYDDDTVRVSTAVVHDRIAAAINVGGGLTQQTIGVPLRVDASGRVSPAVSWEAGAEVRPEVVIADVADAGAYGTLVVNEAPQLAWGVTAGSTLPRVRAAAYGELAAQLGPLRIMPGLRAQLDSAGWAGTVEPRVAVRARLAEQTELRLGGGRYEQRPDTIQLFADPNLPTARAWAATVGLEQTIANRVEILVDGHVKDVDSPTWQPADGAPRAADRGLAFGAELTVRYRLRETFFLWAWAAYGRAFLFEGDTMFPSRADQPFAGGIVASWNITRPLNLALRYRAASGLPFDRIDGSTYDGTLDTWIPRFGTPNDGRMPFYHKIDIHLGYRFTFRKWSLDAAIEAWIVPPSSTPLYPTWNYDYTEQGFVTGPVVLPLFSLRAGF